MSETGPVITILMDKPLHLTARGAWEHGGQPFTNTAVADLFSRSVQFAPKFAENVACWVVKIAAQRTQFTFADTPIFVTALSEEGVATLSSSAYEPLAYPSYQFIIEANHAWYLTSASLPTKARLMPALQQQLSGLIESGPVTSAMPAGSAPPVHIALSRCKIALTDNAAKVVS